ncbi:hypothetical protein Tco_0431756 [Tanacetum coccineum]
MHQFLDSVYKHDTFYRFKIDKKKRFKLTLEVFSDIFKIYPRVQGQDFDALPNDEEIMSFLRDLSHTREIHSLNDVVVDQMHQPWRTFAALINRSLSGKKTGLDKLRLSRAQILWASTEEPTGKSKRVKRHAKKSTQDPARGIVIRETPEILVSKKKEKVDVARGKGIELLSDVALTEEAYAVIIKPSVTNKGTGVKLGVPDVTGEESFESEAESWRNDDDDSNNDQDSGSEESDQDKDSDDDKSQSNNEDESDSEHETDDNESGSKSDQEEDDEKIEDDEEEEEEEIVKTSSNDYDDEDETKIADKAEGDEDEEMDYTTSLLYDDVDIRMNELVDADKGMLKFQSLALLTPILLTVPVSVISDSSHVFSTVIPQSLQSFTPPPLLSTPIPPPTTKATNPPSTLPDFTSVFQFNNRVTILEQKVAELKKDPLQTQVTALVNEHLDAKLGATSDEFMNFLSASLTARITKQVKDQLP